MTDDLIKDKFDKWFTDREARFNAEGALAPLNKLTLIRCFRYAYELGRHESNKPRGVIND